MRRSKLCWQELGSTSGKQSSWLVYIWHYKDSPCLDWPSIFHSITQSVLGGEAFKWNGPQRYTLMSTTLKGPKVTKAGQFWKWSTAECDCFCRAHTPHVCIVGWLTFGRKERELGIDQSALKNIQGVLLQVLWEMKEWKAGDSLGFFEYHLTAQMTKWYWE